MCHTPFHPGLILGIGPSPCNCGCWGKRQTAGGPLGELQECIEECAPESEETMRFWEWDRIRRRCGRAIVPPTCAARTQEYVATAETTMPVSVSKGSLTSGINFLEPMGQPAQTEQPTVTIQPRPRLPTQHRDFPDAILAGIAGSNRNALKMLFGRGYHAWV